MTEESVASTGSQITEDDKLWGMLCHLTAFAGYVIPFGNIIGPLIMWVIKKDQSDYVNKQGKSSLNFEISLTIYVLVSVILIFVIIGIPLLIGLGIFQIVAVIIASIKAYDGQFFKYPLTIEFVK
ncbi:MAG: orotate phosphoribosyltransferase [Gammaproteobacteria bacterium SG8_11]|nr:MAG: orotate phosphoribosyltransferase [Gammaproteobacteria bacterium SG8_11]